MLMCSASDAYDRQPVSPSVKKNCMDDRRPNSVQTAKLAVMTERRFT